MTHELPTVMIGKRKFTILFPDLLRPLTDSEGESLKRSIRKNGVQVPVVVDEEHGVIDGGNRLRLAAEENIKDIPTVLRKGLSDEEKRELAISLNADRRQLTAKEREQLAQERRERIAERREAGESLRTIAEKEGVSVVQVQRDLENLSTVPGGTVEPKDGKVTGKDGRTRRATPKKPPEKEREPGEDDDVFDQRDAERDARKRQRNKPKPARKDAFGHVIPEHLRDLFGDTVLSDCITDLDEAKKILVRVNERLRRKVTHYPFVQAKDAYDALADAEHAAQLAIDSIKPGIPYAVCPACQGEDISKCKKCRFGGHVPEWRTNELLEQGALS